jgi:CheY-like chemotaxis protein
VPREGPLPLEVRLVPSPLSDPPTSAAPRRVRVVIVDDSPQIRALLRRFLNADDRFELVGEGASGKDAIDLVATVAPDLLILDQRMPVLTGVESLPEIRQAAPGTAVVLYSGEKDGHLSGRALAAGAVAVLEKGGTVGTSIVDGLAEILLGHLASPEAEVEIRLGPVDAAAARVWVNNTSDIVAAVRAHPGVLEEPVPDEVLDQFVALLETWRTLAAATDVFFWTARGDALDVETLVDWWAKIDRLSPQQLATLGVHWSPPEGEPFFRALTACVIDAISARRDMEALVAVLRHQWPAVGGQ